MKHSDSNSPVQTAEFSLHPAVGGKSVEAIGLVPPIRLIPVERVSETSTVLELAACGELPQKIKFGTSRRDSARWVEHEIFAYAWALAANREPVQAAEAPPEAHPESHSSPSAQTPVVATTKKPAPGRSPPKSVGRTK